MDIPPLADATEEILSYCYSFPPHIDTAFIGEIVGARYEINDDVARRHRECVISPVRCDVQRLDSLQSEYTTSNVARRACWVPCSF